MFLTTSSFLPHFCVLFLLFTEKHYFVVTLLWNAGEEQDSRNAFGHTPPEQPQPPVEGGLGAGKESPRPCIRPARPAQFPHETLHCRTGQAPAPHPLDPGWKSAHQSTHRVADGACPSVEMFPFEANALSGGRLAFGSHNKPSPLEQSLTLPDSPTEASLTPGLKQDIVQVHPPPDPPLREDSAHHRHHEPLTDGRAIAPVEG